MRTSISTIVEQLDPATLAKKDGHKELLNYLREKRFGTLSLRELPRVYDAFYEQTGFKKVGPEPMQAFCASMEVARRDLQQVDPATKISDNELGYWTLKKSGLDREERRAVLARADETFDFTKISQSLKNLFPTGSTSRRTADRHGGRRWGYVADGDYDEDDYYEDFDDYKSCGDEAMWTQDDDGYWYYWV